MIVMEDQTDIVIRKFISTTNFIKCINVTRQRDNTYVDFRSFDVFFFLFFYRDLVRSNNQRDNDSSGDDEREGQIRVGKEYQINPPEFIPLESKYIINLVHT